MNDKDKTENKVNPNPPVDQEEEIIFPQKETIPPQSPKGKFKIKLSPIKLLGLVAVVIGVYFAGYLTSPEKFQATVDQLKEWISASKETIAPYQEKLTQAIETKVKRKEAESPAPMMKEGEKVPINEKRKVKYWKAPMNPTYIRDNPGKGPMGMDLIPVYEDESEIAGQVKINPTVVQNIGIKTETVNDVPSNMKFARWGI